MGALEASTDEMAPLRPGGIALRWLRQRCGRCCTLRRHSEDAQALVARRTLYTMDGTIQQIARFMRRDGLHPLDHPQLLPPSVRLRELTRLVANGTVVDTSHVDAI